MAAAEQGIDLVHVVALLGAAVVAVPLFKRAGLGSVLGYLAAGLVIGPFGLKLFTSPQAILHVAELGVVMFLFIIGLEMQPSRLWALRREIFGLGAAQVAICGALITGVGILVGFPPVVAFLAAMGFVLSSTAIVCRSSRSAATPQAPQGQRRGVDPAARGPRHRSAAGADRIPRARRAGSHPPADAGLRSASRSPPSRRWWRRGNGCSIRCSACSPRRRRAR